MLTKLQRKPTLLFQTPSLLLLSRNQRLLLHLRDARIKNQAIMVLEANGLPNRWTPRPRLLLPSSLP